MKSYVVIILLSLIAASCTTDEPIRTDSAELEATLLRVPEGFDEIPFPEENEFTYDRWSLGKRLFYDPMMSVDSTVSCASCHRSDLAFSDIETISPGVENRLGKRNSPSLANVAFLPHLLSEGGVPTIEQQVLVPINEHAELDNNILIIAERMNQNPEYVEASQKAYERIPDPYVISRALATFQRTLISGNSPYDKFTFQNEEGALTASEIRGRDLFFSEALSCSSCHGGILFSDHSFQNNGLYEDYSDDGRFLLTLNESDRALFKVPSLRNVGLTPPYMHDGSIETIEEVIAHYESGGAAHPNKSELLSPFHLDADETADLVSFLHSLTDTEFITNELFQPD